VKTKFCLRARRANEQMTFSVKTVIGMVSMTDEPILGDTHMPMTSHDSAVVLNHLLAAASPSWCLFCLLLSYHLGLCMKIMCLRRCAKHGRAAADAQEASGSQDAGRCDDWMESQLQPDACLIVSSDLQQPPENGLITRTISCDHLSSVRAV